MRATLSATAFTDFLLWNCHNYARISSFKSLMRQEYTHLILKIQHKMHSIMHSRCEKLVLNLCAYPLNCHSHIMSNKAPLTHTQTLLEVMEKLRTPETGCPWDLEQDNASILPYTIEEVYEVAEAIHQNDTSALKEELGDLLFQVVFYAQMAAEKGEFTFEDIAQTIAEKMIHRHPHVFSEADIPTADAQVEAWEALKAKEREDASEATTSVLDNIPLAFPALMRAQKISKRVAREGFDWPNVEQVFDKVQEELAEIKEAISEKNQAHIEEEIGDALFAMVNLARHAGADAETALAAANRKFESRFRYIEGQLAAQSTSLKESNLEALEVLWQAAKKKEKAA